MRSGLVASSYLCRWMNLYDKYEVVIGLEVRAQLLSKSKAYNDAIATDGGEPNAYVSPVTLGDPGTLPVFNYERWGLGIKLGLTTNYKLVRYNQFASKNYLYTDLPKGYQITHDTAPVSTRGYVVIGAYGIEKTIGIHGIQMQGEGGESIQDSDLLYILVDFNRAGTPTSVKKGLLGLLLGEEMKLSPKKANPKLPGKLLEDKFNN